MDKYIDSYKKLKSFDNGYLKVKNFFKNYIIKLNFKNKIDNSNRWVQFPFYHHVFKDENENFISQIMYMKKFGDFISYNDAVEVLKNNLDKKNNYFCLSFDDGFKNNIENVCDFLDKVKIPAIFFLPTTFIDNNRDDSGKIFFNNSLIKIEFLNWIDCKLISKNKLFSFGSHSLNHNVLSKLSNDASFKEMKNSKLEIEKKLNIKCEHFAPPVGDFLNPRDPNYSKEIGYKTFSTTNRGKMISLNSDSCLIYRHHLLANWDLSYLNFFFNK